MSSMGLTSLPREVLAIPAADVHGLDVHDNAIEQLDLSQLTSLKRLNCASNRVGQLHLSGCQQLHHLSLQKNKCAQALD